MTLDERTAIYVVTKETLIASPRVADICTQEGFPSFLSYLAQCILFSRDTELGFWNMQNFQVDQKFWRTDCRTFFQIIALKLIPNKPGVRAIGISR